MRDPGRFGPGGCKGQLSPRCVYRNLLRAAEEHESIDLGQVCGYSERPAAIAELAGGVASFSNDLFDQPNQKSTIPQQLHGCRIERRLDRLGDRAQVHCVDTGQLTLGVEPGDTEELVVPYGHRVSVRDHDLTRGQKLSRPRSGAAQGSDEGALIVIEPDCVRPAVDHHQVSVGLTGCGGHGHQLVFFGPVQDTDGLIRFSGNRPSLAIRPSGSTALDDGHSGTVRRLEVGGGLRGRSTGAEGEPNERDEEAEANSHG